MKLRGLYQGPSQSISEYMYELQELFSMIEMMPDNMKVIKLWYGLRPRNQDPKGYVERWPAPRHVHMGQNHC